ncbi:hypothetical protein C8Q78DRAFT_1083676 [Trametes maxima]|nr:hypothetical protein C8Q78DRAFT_1083676 [Trametes maxima]
MLQELSHMDRITHLQDDLDEIQQVRALLPLAPVPTLTLAPAVLVWQLLTSRANFVQVNHEIPITKARRDVFAANKKELVTDLMVKAKQAEYLIQSLPEPDPEEKQVERLQALEEEMEQANAEYVQAVNRAKSLHGKICDVLRNTLDGPGIDKDEAG